MPQSSREPGTQSEDAGDESDAESPSFSHPTGALHITAPEAVPDIAKVSSSALREEDTYSDTSLGDEPTTATKDSVPSASSQASSPSPVRLPSAEKQTRAKQNILRILQTAQVLQNRPEEPQSAIERVVTAGPHIPRVDEEERKKQVQQQKLTQQRAQREEAANSPKLNQNVSPKSASPSGGSAAMGLNALIEDVAVKASVDLMAKGYEVLPEMNIHRPSKWQRSASPSIQKEVLDRILLEESSEVKPPRKPRLAEILGNDQPILSANGKKQVSPAPIPFLTRTAGLPVGEYDEDVTRVHRAEDKKMARKLKGFDRRYVTSITEGKISQLIQNKKSKEEIQKSGRDMKKRPTLFNFGNGAGNGRGDTLQEQNVNFIVAKYSSQRPECPASDLTKERGKWESAHIHVHNEWIVFQLVNPEDPDMEPLSGSLSSMHFTLPGNDSAPHHIRVACSDVSADGPFHEVFRFEIQSKEDFKAHYFHDYYKIPNEFKDILIKTFGTIENAWTDLLDANGDGILTFLEFSTACRKLQDLPAVRKIRTNVFEDIQKIFDCFDLHENGTICLDDLLLKETKVPSGAWWRLWFVNNWGSFSTVCLCAPLTFRAVTVVKDPIKERGITQAIKERTAEEDLSKAFCLRQLGVTAHQEMLRTEAKKHQMPLQTVEDVHHRFVQVDINGDGTIDKDEFEQLMLKVHGAKDSSDIPNARLRFFWQNADRDGNGEIDFGEFLTWASMYFFTKDNLDASGQVSPQKVVENFYSVTVCKRVPVRVQGTFAARHGLDEDPSDMSEFP